MNNLDIDSAYVGLNSVDKVYLGSEAIWPTTPPAPVPYDEQYFTIEVLSLDPDNPEYEPELDAEESGISISINGGPWTEIAAYGEHQILAVGDKVRFKKEAAYKRPTNAFTVDFCRYAAYGNIESMEYGDNFSGQTAVRAEEAFGQFFSGSYGLVTAENLILPATTLQKSCYARMFQSCTNLTSAPVLPARTLPMSCYDSMFRDCTNLTSAPVLPARTLQPSCYARMFQGCTNLTSAPVLPARTLQTSCYDSMFRDCTNLNTITCLATKPANYYSTNWVQGVSSTGTFYKASRATWPTGNNGVPSGWTVVDYVEPNN